MKKTNRLVARAGTAGLVLLLSVGCSVTSPPEYGTVRSKSDAGTGSSRYTAVVRGTDHADREVKVPRSRYAGLRRGECWSRSAKKEVDASFCASEE